jgi:hypothetical protein
MYIKLIKETKNGYRVIDNLNGVLSVKLKLPIQSNQGGDTHTAIL